MMIAVGVSLVLWFLVSSRDDLQLMPAQGSLLTCSKLLARFDILLSVSIMIST